MGVLFRLVISDNSGEWREHLASGGGLWPNGSTKQGFAPIIDLDMKNGQAYFSAV